MKNITRNFCSRYQPLKALLIYARQAEPENETENAVYVESYDIGRNGKPINAHPLTLKETLMLTRLFQQSSELQTGYLRPRGLLPANMLHLNPQPEGYALWWTPPQPVPLYFAEALDIPSGSSQIPAMVWKANREQLWVYALKRSRKPQLTAQLYHAPFFNLYRDGRACMGTVNISIQEHSRLEDFMAAWQTYFWNSYFSHLIGGFDPVTGDLVQLWREQVGSGEPFPVHRLRRSPFTLNQLCL